MLKVVLSQRTLSKCYLKIVVQDGNSIDWGHLSGHFWDRFLGHFLPYGIRNGTTVVKRPKNDTFQMALRDRFQDDMCASGCASGRKNPIELPPRVSEMSLVSKTCLAVPAAVDSVYGDDDVIAVAAGLVVVAVALRSRRRLQSDPRGHWRPAPATSNALVTLEY